MYILSPVLCSGLVRMCNRMSDRWTWTRLCYKCKRVYARYGTDEIPPDIDDPLEVFDATDVNKNVMRFVVCFLWLKRQPNSFEEYLRVRELRLNLWKDCVCKLSRL